MTKSESNLESREKAVLNDDLLAVLDAANAHVPDGYQVAKDTLPERVELMANGLRSFAVDRKILREENWRLREALEKFRAQFDNLGCTGTAETVLESLEPKSSANAELRDRSGSGTPPPIQPL